MSAPTLLVDPPVREKRVGGLTGVAEFRSNDRLSHVEKLVFQSDGCEFPETEESRCLATAPVADKKFATTSTVDGIASPVTLYAGVKCFAAPDADEVERARRALEDGRDRTLEGVLGGWAAGGRGIPDAANAKKAVAGIDHVLDKEYVGRGVILMSRYDAADAGLEDADGDAPLRTKMGTLVIASGRIDPGVVYGLGAIVVEHGELVERDAIDPLSNTHYALAEQVHAILVDCEYRIKSTITA